MAADGSIIIDTRINNKGAEADLKALQAKAKSTAQQISALDKQLGQATSKRSKLADDLAAASQQAEGTAQALDEINAKLDAARAKNLAAVQKEFPGMSAGNAASIAESRTKANSADLIGESDRLAQQLAQQEEKAAQLNSDYQAQGAVLQKLNAQHQALSGQLEKEKSAVTALAQIVSQMQADNAMQAYFAKQEAAISRSFEAIEKRQTRLTGGLDDPVRHAEAVVQATQKEILAQDRAAKAAEERAAREEAAAKRRALANGTTPANVGQNPAERINAASKAMQRFGSRMREIVSGALLFNIISSGLSALVRWMGSALQSTDAFGQALRNLQGAASVAAAPLIDALGNALAYIINLLATAMSYLARFISMLTGKSLSAMKSSAKAMNSYGAAAGSAAKQTEKATRSLAGFDEITRLDAPQEESSGGGGGGAAGPNYDFVDGTGAGFSSLLDTVKRFWVQFTAALAPSIAAWGAAWEQIKATAMAVWPQIQAAASGLWTNALQPLLTYLAGTWAPGILNAFSQAFAPIIGGAVSTWLQVFADWFTWACQLATDAINNLLVPALDLVLIIWQGLMTGIQAAWAQYGQPLMDGVVAAIQNLETIYSNLYYTVIEPIVANLIQLLQRLWTQHLQQLWNDVVAMLGAMGTAVLDLWNNILAPVINWLVATFGPLFADVFNAAAGAVQTAVGFMADVIDIAVTVFRGILDFLSAVFRGDWDAAWNAIASTVSSVWDRIGNTIKSAANGIIGFVNGMVQAIFNGLNMAIQALNHISIDLPEWLGGGHFGFNIGAITAPQIPYLAQGAVIPPNREFMAVLGDQSHGTNVEAPLATIQQAVAAVTQDNLDGELAALEAIRGTLLDILQAVYGIDLSSNAVGRAMDRYQVRQAIITGRG